MSFTFTKSSKNTFWSKNFSMSFRAKVPSFFIDSPPFPIIIDFCVGLSVYMTAEILTIFGSTLNDSTSTSQA